MLFYSSTFSGVNASSGPVSVGLTGGIEKGGDVLVSASVIQSTNPTFPVGTNFNVPGAFYSPVCASNVGSLLLMYGGDFSNTVILGTFQRG
jgi:hypothetical protein